MRIDRPVTSSLPRSLNAQLAHMARSEEVLAQLARLHWVKWDVRPKGLGSTGARRINASEEAT
jgi:hypothetical protein